MSEIDGLEWTDWEYLLLNNEIGFVSIYSLTALIASDL